MEIQITDFENAAFAVFIVLVTRAILSYDLNFYIPIQKVGENMETAHSRDAVLEEKFWFRRNPLPTRLPRPYNAAGSGASTPVVSRPPTPTGPVEDEYALMSVDEIVNGSSEFPGLIPLVESYLGSVNVDVETRCELQRYLDLIRRRADGTLWTAAKWIREFVKGHEGYRGDSVVGEDINHDLIGAVIAIERDGGKGVANVEKLLGKQRQRGGQ